MQDSSPVIVAALGLALGFIVIAGIVRLMPTIPPPLIIEHIQIPIYPPHTVPA